MKRKIFDYLKTYNINCDYLINSGKDNLHLLIKRPNELIPHVKTNVYIHRGQDEIDIFFRNAESITEGSVFHELNDELINFINDNSEKKVEGSYNLGYYGWESDDLKISIGLINEPICFEARLTLFA